MPKKTRWLTTLVAALMIAPATGQALADTAKTAEFVPNLRAGEVWFTCPGETGIAQLDGAATWSADAPGDGDGCGSVDTGYQATSAGDTTTDTVFHGGFTGNLDSLTVRLHRERGVEGDMTDIALGLTVDGEERVPWPTDATAIRTEETPPGVVEVSVHRIGLLDETDNAPHELVLTLSLRGELARGVWQWGSADTPSGIKFHPHHLAETVIAATDPSAPPEEDPATVTVGPAVVAGPQSHVVGFFTPRLAMAPSTTLSFGNGDLVGHDVTSRARDAAGRPLFRSPVTTTGTISTVAGAENLAAGSYDFYCSLHPNMSGTLTVAGSVPTPHGG